MENLEIEYDFNEKDDLKIRRRPKKFQFSGQNILLYIHLLAWGGLIYGFIQNRMLSSRVNKLQGEVDNLYQKINNSNRSNEVLNRK